MGYLFECHRMESDGFKKLPHGEKTGFEKDDVLFKGEYRRGPHKLLLKTAYAQEESHETYLGLTEEDFMQSSHRRYAASANDLMKWDHHQYQLRYSTVFDEDIKVRATVYRHKFNRNWSKLSGFKSGVPLSNYLNIRSKEFDPHFLRVLRGESRSLLDKGEDHLIIGHNDRRYDSGGGDLGVSLPFELLGLYHELSLGFRYHRDQVERDHILDEFQMMGGRLHSLNQKRVGTQNVDRTDATSLSLENAIDFSNGIILSMGLRWEDMGMKRAQKNRAPLENSYQVIVPGLGIQYLPSEALVMLLAVNRGISAVSPGQVGSPGPEESINGEVGFKYRGLFEWEWIGFYSNYTNIKGMCSFSSGCREEDIGLEYSGGRAQIYGFESRLGMDWTAFSTHFPLSLSYTKTITGFLEEQTSIHREWGVGEIRKGDPLPYVPEDKVSLSLGVEWDKFSGFLIYNWQSLVYDQTVQEGRRTVAAYGTLDGVGKFRYSEEGEVFIRVENILASDYVVSLRPYGARPGKPQVFSLGLNHVF